MKTDESVNFANDYEGIEALGWFDEADRALGDCLKRIEQAASDAVPHQALRTELLFMLRAARADLVSQYVQATYPAKQEPERRSSENAAASS